MAAIGVDSGANEKGWSGLMHFNWPVGSGYVEKARKVASTTVNLSQKMLWSTGKAVKIASSSVLVFVAPKYFQTLEVHSDLEGGPPGTPQSTSVK